MVKQGKKIISTCSNCNDTDPQKIPYTKVIELNGRRTTEKKVKVTRRPTVVKELFRSFSCIDVHDHYRQGILGLERHWHTTVWWHRLLATILGVIFTDSFFAYRMDHRKANGNMETTMMSYEDFLGELCHSMINNNYNATTLYSDTRSSKRKASDIASSPLLVSFIVTEALIGLMGVFSYRSFQLTLSDLSSN